VPKPSPHINKLKATLKAKSSAKRAASNARFFKTGSGEYGEGDIFIGVTVPDIRAVAKQFIDLSLFDLKRLLTSPIHEERLCALLICVAQFESAASNQGRKKIYDFYLKNLKHVNNWDLVDSSAHKIVGAYLCAHKSQTKPLLNKLITTKHLWSERVAILTTFYFIKHNEFGQEKFKLTLEELRGERDAVKSLGLI